MLDYFFKSPTTGMLLIIALVVIYLIWSEKISLNSVEQFMRLPKGQGDRRKILEKYTKDFTKLTPDAQHHPIIGRDVETKRLIQILSRRSKNNAILLGEPGVGKTAVVEGLAQRIVSGDVPDEIRGKKVLSLQVSNLLSGTKYRGEFEDRVRQIIEEISSTKRSVILFIDEIHTVIQSHGTEGSINFSDILKPALARGDLQLIGATTTAEYEKYIKQDSSLQRRFQEVLVGEPTVEQTKLIVEGVLDKYKQYHQVEFTDKAVELAVKLSNQQIHNRKLPDKAIDVIDEAAAMVKIDHTDKITHQLLNDALTTKYPKLVSVWNEIQKLDTLISQSSEQELSSLIQQREALEHEIDQNGVAVVDVGDIEEVIKQTIQHNI